MVLFVHQLMGDIYNEPESLYDQNFSIWNSLKIYLYAYSLSFRELEDDTTLMLNTLLRLAAS